jgi:putative methyltransferase
LQAEFTKARLKKKCGTVEHLKALLLSEKPVSARLQPRWIRINTLKSNLEHELATTFKEYKTDATINQVASALATAKILAIDQHIPDLLAVPPDANFTKTRAYTDGAIILQDKASCFPAYLLTGDQVESETVGDCIDGCAAPGNKTSHLAALFHSQDKRKINIYACEKDERRSKTLISMTEKAGAQNVIVLERQDFLALDPQDSRFADVTHLLLDPSCSGSGILGREDLPTLMLPIDPKARKSNGDIRSKGSKKRKRDQGTTTISNDDAAETSAEETKDTTYDLARLQRLAILQTKIVQHAFAFPAATRVTYSTCSVHVEENEAVVSKVLGSQVAKSRGWSVLRRQEQVSGLRDWVHRGVETTMTDGSLPLNDEVREACIRCHPGDEQGTMGFFLCGFVRDPSDPKDAGLPNTVLSEDDEHWEGFSD